MAMGGPPRVRGTVSIGSRIARSSSGGGSGPNLSPLLVLGQGSNCLQGKGAMASHARRTRRGGKEKGKEWKGSDGGRKEGREVLDKVDPSLDWQHV